MGNDVKAFIPELWSKRVQLLKKRKSIIYAIGNFEEHELLEYGSEVTRPYMIDDLEINKYVRWEDGKEQAIKTAPEKLLIDNENEITVYIDKHDKKQSKYDIEKQFTERASNLLVANEDGRFLEEILFAEYSLDAGVVNKTNVADIVVSAKDELTVNDVEDNELILVGPSKLMGAIELNVVKDGFNLADSTLKNGYAGDFIGVSCYKNNNLPHLTELNKNPADGDTITINGVKITFKTTPATAGDVKMGASLAESLENANKVLLGAMENSSTGKALADDQRKKVKRVRAKLVVGEGNKAYVFTSGRATIALTGFATAKTYVYAMLGKKKTIDCVIQEMPEVDKNKAPKRKGYYYMATDLFGVKSFKEGRERMIKIKMEA